MPNENFEIITFSLLWWSLEHRIVHYMHIVHLYYDFLYFTDISQIEVVHLNISQMCLILPEGLLRQCSR